MSKRKFENQETKIVTIGISGKIGSGKSTLSAALKQCCEEDGWCVFERNFADKLKELVAFFYHIDVALCYSQEGKNTILPPKDLSYADLVELVAFHFHLSTEAVSKSTNLNARYGSDMTAGKMLQLWENLHLENFTKCQTTVGQALQNWGTALRNVDPQLWIKSVADFIDEKKGTCSAEKILFLIPDTRFENEAEYIRCELSGMTVRLNGDPGAVAKNSQRDLTHISETALDKYDKFTTIFDTNSENVDCCVAKTRRLF